MADAALTFAEIEAAFPEAQEVCLWRSERGYIVQVCRDGVWTAATAPTLAAALTEAEAKYG